MEVETGRRTFGRRRRVLIGFNVAAMSLVATVLAIAVLYLSQRPELRSRVDLTAEQVFTLSEQTRNILNGLEKPVHVITLFYLTDFDQSTGLALLGFGGVIGEVRDLTVDLLQEYRFASGGQIEPEVLDYSNPRDMQRIEQVRREYKIQANSVLVVSEDRRQAIALDDLADLDRGNYYQGTPRPPKLVGYKGEEALTSAISAVATATQPVIYFLQGHGEKRPDTAGLDGINGFLTNLQNDNIVTKRLSLAGSREVPEDATVLAVMAPEKEIPRAEVETIARYLRRGGRLFAALEPSNRRALQDLLLEFYGIFMESGVVCFDKSRAGGVDPDKTQLFVEDRYGPDVPAVRYHRARHLRTVLLGAGSLRNVDPLPSGVDLKPLMWTREEAWVDPVDVQGDRAFDGGRETKGPRTLGVQATGGSDAPGSRAIVIADLGFLTNAVRGYPGNQDLATNCVEWLTGRESHIGISPRSYRRRKVDLSPSEYDAIFIYTILLMPSASVLLGLLVWWLRRR